VIEPFFELNHMVAAIAEVIKIMDRLGAGLANDIGEAGLACIGGPVAKLAIGIRDPPMRLASAELEEMAVRLAKCRLKDQMQPVKAKVSGTTRRRITFPN
jgi:hypothetical protein